jgi:hypothetical protein
MSSQALATETLISMRRHASSNTLRASDLVDFSNTDPARELSANRDIHTLSGLQEAQLRPVPFPGSSAHGCSTAPPNLGSKSRRTPLIFNWTNCHQLLRAAVAPIWPHIAPSSAKCRRVCFVVCRRLASRRFNYSVEGKGTNVKPVCRLTRQRREF